jgi:hypothetical protein
MKPVIAVSGALAVKLDRPVMNRPGYHTAPRERG